MSTLDRAVDALLGPRPNWQQDRKDAVAGFEEIVKCCKSAAAIWNKAQSGTAPQMKIPSLVVYVGADSAKELNHLNLQVRQLSYGIAEQAEPYYLGSAISMEPHIIEEAYRQLDDDETLADAAKKAIDNLEKRITWLQGLIKKLQSAGAPKKAPKAKAGKKAAKPKKKAKAKKKPKKKTTKKKKTAKKKTKNKAKKKAAKKKKSVKKAKKKKTAKKKTKKKVKKKAVKKKAKKKVKKKTKKKAKKKKRR